MDCPILEVTKMLIKEVDDELRGVIKHFRGTSTLVVSRGQVHHLDKLPGYVVMQDDEVKALISYNIVDKKCEIVSLDSNVENQGFGSSLIESVIEKARNTGCKSIWLITSNANIKAIRFYQKRGFDMRVVHHNAIDEARKIKPSIPLTSEDGIPIRHEIEFEKLLNSLGMI